VGNKGDIVVNFSLLRSEVNSASGWGNRTTGSC